MIDSLQMEYGVQMGRRIEEIIESSNGTDVDQLGFDAQSIRREAEIVLKNMDSELRKDFNVLCNNYTNNLIDFEHSLDK